jgi:ribonuclease HI
MEMVEVDIYTDGACSGNPGPGGWGALLKSSGREREIWGGEPQTTNNRMEILAVIRALEQLRGATVVRVHTDSQYVQKGISEWIHGWKARGWITAAKTPVKNVDLWRALDEAACRHRVEWHWVRGHAGDRDNERADALARRGVRASREAGCVVRG